MSAYGDTLDYLFAQLPMFHRIGSAAYKADLDNTIALCERLDHPEKKFRSVHIAGTNGKGSTSHLLASVLQSSGLKTGLYTSPHLKDFRERIRINGNMIPKSRVVRFVEEHRAAFDQIQPSFFEWTVALAFDYFAEEKVDIAVIEVGLGGRLDSTNVIMPLLSVITNISFDHMNLLGNTLPKIAAEKAGIIKPGIPVVIGETQEEVTTVFLRTAKKNRAPIVFADQHYQLKNIRRKNGAAPLLQADVYRDRKKLIANISCPLSGSYQQKNLATVLQAVELLQKSEVPISQAAIRNGIKNVVAQTGLQGRWQQLSRKPLTIADTGHNEAGIREVLRMIRHTPHKGLHVVLGMVNDKDISKILSLLPKKATYYFCRANIPRALDAATLAAEAKVHKLHGKSYRSVRAALNAAQSAAGKNDLVFVGGSTFTVAEVV